MKNKSSRWLFLLALLFLFLFAVLLWFYRGDLEGLFSSVRRKTAPEQSQKPSQEKISEEDRKKLEEILKRR